MRIAVLGLGRMGSAIAQRLVDAEHDVSVWNRTAEAAQTFRDAGIPVLARPSDTWARADAAITMVADGDALEELAIGREDGLLAGGTGGVMIDMSTVSPASSARVASACG